jgi:hypothetical protein
MKSRLLTVPQRETPCFPRWHAACKGERRNRIATMKALSFRKPFLAVCLTVSMGLGAVAQTTPVTPPAPKLPSAPPASKSLPPLPADMQKLADQVNAQSAKMLADRQALLNQLKGATEEQRKAILEKLKAQEKDLLDAQRALGKQIRDDLRKLRPTQPPGGR